MNKHLLGAIFMGTAALLFFVFVMPKFSEFSAARATRAQRTRLLADSEKAQARVEELAEQYEANRASLQKIFAAFPKNRQLDYVTSSIHTAAQQSGLELKSLAIGNADKKKGEYETSQVRLELSGRYAGMLQFLGNLESSVRLYDIEKLDVAEASESGGFLTITLILNTYSIP